MIPLAYALHNVFILILSAVVFFVWFGGFTGYSSSWGAYWFGMNYPLRFLLAGAIIILVGLLHRFSEEKILVNYRDFYKVWLSVGIYFSEMALWLLSLFGNFNRDLPETAIDAAVDRDLSHPQDVNRQKFEKMVAATWD